MQNEVEALHQKENEDNETITNRVETVVTQAGNNNEEEQKTQDEQSEKQQEAQSNQNEEQQETQSNHNEEQLETQNEKQQEIHNEKQKQTSITIAHMSDIHVWKDPPQDSVISSRWRDYKRYHGYLQLSLFRGPQCFSIDMLQASLKDVLARNAHHLIVSGDLTNISMPFEFEFARNLLQDHFLNEKLQVASVNHWKQETWKVLTVVPGNHDTYVPDAIEQDYFGRYFADAFEHTVKIDNFAARFPSVKHLPHSDVLVIGINTGTANSLVSSAGTVDQTQLSEAVTKITTILEQQKRKLDSFFKILVMHHPPIARFSIGLIDAIGCLADGDRARVSLFCDLVGVDMVLYGHTHHPLVSYLGNKYQTLAVDVGSSTLVTTKENKGRYNEYKIIGNKLHSITSRIWNLDSKKFDTINVPIPPKPNNPQQ